MVFLKSKVLLFCLAVGTIRHSQQLIQTVADAFKLNNATAFWNKPLKTLLKEIAPEIKMVTVNPDASDERPACIISRFVDRKKFNQYRCMEQFPISLWVCIKQSFLWEKGK